MSTMTITRTVTTTTVTRHAPKVEPVIIKAEPVWEQLEFDFREGVN